MYAAQQGGMGPVFGGSRAVTGRVAGGVGVDHFMGHTLGYLLIG